jgi:divalent metal cation (Fe/Co/Zn/Cd) transporter
VNRAGGRARTAGETAGRSRGLVTGTAGESRWTVIVALAINLLIAAAKSMAALLTGSSSLFAEAAHSVADSGNEALLLVALRRSSRPADAIHPFGYGAERFYWSLLAAIGIFVAGGVTTVFYEDSAAVVGILFAVAGVALHQVTHSAVPDAAASIAIGLLLVVVAVRLASRERELLTNQSASPAVVGVVRRALESAPEVESVPRLEVMIIGPRAALVTAEVRLADEPSGERVSQVLAGLRDLVRDQPLIAEVYLTPVGIPQSGGPR